MKNKKSKVSYLGQLGSYSHIAAGKYFGEKIKGVGRESLSDVFESIKRGNATQGIVPIENSLIGSIYETYDLLEKTKLKIVGELYLKINFHLLVKHYVIPAKAGIYTDPRVRKDDKMSLNKIKKVYVFYKSFEQCRNFLHTNPNMKIEFTKDNGSSAKLLKEDMHTDIAAISSEQAAILHGLTIQKRNVDDHTHNYTRFLVVSKKSNKIGDKMTMQLTLKHIPGSLHTALGSLAKNNINLTKIESRPLIGAPWEYLFYIDIETSLNREKALAEMKRHVHSLKMLGTYMKGKVYET